MIDLKKSAVSIFTMRENQAEHYQTPKSVLVEKIDDKDIVEYDAVPIIEQNTTEIKLLKFELDMLISGEARHEEI